MLSQLHLFPPSDWFNLHRVRADSHCLYAWMSPYRYPTRDHVSAVSSSPCPLLKPPPGAASGAGPSPELQLLPVLPQPWGVRPAACPTSLGKVPHILSSCPSCRVHKPSIASHMKWLSKNFFLSPPAPNLRFTLLTDDSLKNGVLIMSLICSKMFFFYF